jgi:hypothetical protein
MKNLTTLLASQMKENTIRETLHTYICMYVGRRDIEQQKMAAPLIWDTNRVTRLGDFSPKGDCLLWADFFKIKEVAHIFGATFSDTCINFDKEWVGRHFGRFFHKLIRSRCTAIYKCSVYCFLCENRQ